MMLAVFALLVIITISLLLPVIGFGFIQEMRENGEFYTKETATGWAMQPIIEDQDMIIVQLKTHPSFDLNIGDILVFTTPSGYPSGFIPGGIVGHRIVQMEMVDGEMLYHTKADNVGYLDTAPVTNDNIVGKVYRIVDEGSLEATMVDWFI